ncbi:TRAP transporter small permease [Actibacterium ureilyticum]|uniref:TRAP transporter small permease n=1 Tax=Actibacterium ureilyticum TaxID=1590614 RepID=UPI000BAA989D|nr:TRAP transporter small permease subunit [Actibacterium ureilyticum]
MKTFENWIDRISIACVSVALLAMMLQIVIDVFMRSLLGSGFPSTADLVSRYYMVAISLLPLAVTEIHRRHIEATIFTDALRGGWRQAVAWLGIGIGLCVFGLMAYATFGEAMKQTTRGAYVEVGTTVFQTWPSYWIPALSFALMTVVLLLRVYQLATGRFDLSGHDPIEEVDSTAGGNA